MKSFLLTFALSIALYSCGVNDEGSGPKSQGGIYEGNITLFSQESLDNFAENNYSEITGDLNLDRANQQGLIVDLEPLSSLRRVGGSLNIAEINTPDLEGLQNITFIGDDFILSRFLGEDLSGLEGLTEVGGELRIEGGINVTTLEGLNNLRSVSAVSIFAVDITTLAPLATIQSELKFIQLTGLTQVSSLAPLTNSSGELESVTIIDCSGLEDLSSLANKIGANMKVISLIELSITNLDVLSNVSSIESRLILNELPQISHLNALSNLSGINGDLRIEGNSQLNDFCGLQTLFTNQGVGGDVRIWQNAYNPTPGDIINGNCSN